MKHPLVSATLLILIMIGLVSSPSIAGLEAPPTPEKLRRWAGDSIVQGKRVGIDYGKLLDLAIARDARGLSGLFRFTVSDGFIGAGAEDHCSILLGLLQRWGDKPFASVLRTQKPQVRKAVIDAIDYSFPHPGWKPRQFPETYALGPHDRNPNV